MCIMPMQLVCKQPQLAVGEFSQHFWRGTLPDIFTTREMQWWFNEMKNKKEINFSRQPAAQMQAAGADGGEFHEMQGCTGPILFPLVLLTSSQANLLIHGCCCLSCTLYLLKNISGQFSWKASVYPVHSRSFVLYSILIANVCSYSSILCRTWIWRVYRQCQPMRPLQPEWTIFWWVE